MTKGKATGSKAQSNQVLSRLQSNMKKLQHDAESLLSKTRSQASHLISRDQQRAVKRLFNQAQRLRADLEKRAQRASRDVESRAERLLSTLEKEAGKRLGPLLRRLDLPSRQEVNTLSRRIAQLERRMRPQPSAAAEGTPVSSPPPAEAPPASTGE